MGKLVEPVGGGLVVTRDASLLNQGELTVAEDVHYRPGSPSLYSAPGREKMSGDVGGEITGLVYCGFDEAEDRLVVQVDSEYKLVTVSTGAVSDLDDVTPGTSLEAVHFEDRHYLLNGANSNLTLLSDGTTRSHGMIPVTSAPGVTHHTSGGSWNDTLAPVPNTYEYWVTEVYRNGDEELESDFQYDGTLTGVTITDTNDYVSLAMPTPVNTALGEEFLFWRLYRGQARANAGVPSFPRGWKIAEFPISKMTFDDGLAASTTAYQNPSTAANGTGTAWTDPTNVFATDNARATLSLLSTSVSSTLLIGGYPFVVANIGTPISDIRVKLEGFCTATDPFSRPSFSVALSWDGGLSWTTEQTIHTPTAAGSESTSPYPSSVGGTWGRSWVPAELASGTFFVRVKLYGRVPPGDAPTTFSAGIDHVAVSVDYGAADAALIEEFPRIEILNPDGSTSALGAHGQPPTASMGDIFQDTMVTNDVEVPVAIAYSLPGEPEYFPEIYRMRFDTSSKDVVTCIKTLSTWLIVGLAGQVWRVNWLPQAADSEFQPGRAKELIDPFNGIVGPKAACLFVMAGELLLAYVSGSQLRFTNGYSADALCPDVDLTDFMDAGDAGECELVNDPHFSELVLQYSAGGEWEQLRFSYHQTHRKEGGLKVTGPVGCRARRFAQGFTAAGEPLLYGGFSDGFVYRENRGNQDASGNGISPRIATREMYLNGPGDEWTYDNLYIHQAGAEGTISATLEIVKTNLNPRTSQTMFVEGVSRGLSLIGFREEGEGIRTEIAMPNPVQIDYLVLEGTSIGTSDSFG